MEEKRRHKRLDMMGELLLHELCGAGGAETSEIEITDCSRDGIGFSSDQPLTIGSNYEANLVLWNKDKIHVFIQIVRAEKRDNGFHYGGIFIGMPDSDQMRIQVYETVEDTLAEQNK